jgi:hypothetical protein
MDDYVITIDVEWAPCWMIEYMASILIEKRVKATWFVTHKAPAIEALRKRSDLFELGVHPNFLVGSTHGSSEDKVMRHVKDIVPDAVSMRTHGLYQTSRFLTKAAKDYGISFDVSLFLPRAPDLVYHLLKWQGINLWRIPYFWEDDSEMFEHDPIWTISDPRLHVRGLKIFDFHPPYIALNTDTFSVYEKLKQEKPLPEWDVDFLQPHVSDRHGPRTLFLELVNHLSHSGGKWIKELVLKP